MKNQYVGDIGDFGKYALLRAFIGAGVKVGVNWYLTENDGSTDGKFTDYLNKDKMSRYDPDLFDTLKTIAFKPDKSVFDIQNSGILSDTVLYSELLDLKGTAADRGRNRKEWFEKSIKALSDAELIFMDPDNGLLESDDPSKKNAEKYVLPSEIEEYFNRGHNVVYYCHKGRRGFGDWESYKSLMFERIPEAKPTVLTYHKGSQRSYIFLIHEKDFVQYRKIIDKFMAWKRSDVFSEEFTFKGDTAGNVTGEGLSVKGSDGITVTIEKRADGNIQIRRNDHPNAVTILSADSFIDSIVRQ